MHLLAGPGGQAGGSHIYTGVVDDLDPDLERLSFLIRLRNMIDQEMANVLGRPPSAGNLGEFIAAKIFDIQLVPSGVNPGHDGRFQSGPFAGKTVNVKLYSEDAGLLDISAHPADYYLVLTGAAAGGNRRCAVAAASHRCGIPV